MFPRLRPMPIQRKLRLVVLATCTAALCVASGALFAVQFFNFKRDFRRDLVAVAEIIASNSTAAVQIQNLADTARRIASKNDYSVRATKIVDDEVGSFTDSFNSMLDQIQAHDSALRHEIAERKRAESELQRTQQELIDASRQAGMA